MEIVTGVLAEGEVAFVQEAAFDPSFGAESLRDVAAVSLGVSVARGGEWMGWRIPRFRRVACIQRQWTEAAFEGLVGASLLDPTTKAPPPGHEAVLGCLRCFAPKTPILGFEAGHKALMEMVDGWDPALIVLVSLESLEAAFDPSFAALRQLSRGRGAAVLVSMSFPAPIGSRVLDSLPDAVWNIRSDGKPAGRAGWTGTLKIRRWVQEDVQEIERRFLLTTNLRFMLAPDGR